MNRLLMTAVADTSKMVRYTVLLSLVESDDLDSYISQPEWWGTSAPWQLHSNEKYVFKSLPSATTVLITSLLLKGWIAHCNSHLSRTGYLTEPTRQPGTSIESNPLSTVFEADCTSCFQIVWQFSSSHPNSSHSDLRSGLTTKQYWYRLQCMDFCFRHCRFIATFVWILLYTAKLDISELNLKYLNVKNLILASGSGDMVSTMAKSPWQWSLWRFQSISCKFDHVCILNFCRYSWVGDDANICVFCYSLTALFIIFNDESSFVRALAIRLAGRLAAMNPAYVLPALRNHLQQLLTDMERSPDSRQREGTVWALFIVFDLLFSITPCLQSFCIQMLRCKNF